MAHSIFGEVTTVRKFAHGDIEFDFYHEDEITTYRYDDMGHVESLWGYNDEFGEAIVTFFNNNLGS